jgi:hypothetical protein
VCELLASHIPDDEAMLLKNGRLDFLLFGDKHRLSSDFPGYLSDASVLSHLDVCNNCATTSLSGTTQYLIWEVFFCCLPEQWSSYGSIFAYTVCISQEFEICVSPEVQLMLLCIF